jgi:hypothetical protein
MSTTENTASEVVSERFGNIARINSRGALAQAKQLEDVAIEARIGDGIQRLPVPVAATLAAALGGALDHIRHENPALLSTQALSAPEIDLVLSAVQWVRILQAEGHSIDNITHSGVERSALLRRLRSGRAALEIAPPTSFGQPWYEVLESGPGTVHKVSTDGKVTTLAELLGTLDGSATARSQMLVSINGCHWHIVSTKVFGTSFVVRFQGHEPQFELTRNDAPDGSGWTLHKIQH